MPRSGPARHKLDRSHAPPRYRTLRASAAPRATLFVEPLDARRLLAAQIVGSPTVYATIQAAVNAAPVNATITVDAGVYNEVVTVHKTLTLKGAQAGVDGRSNARNSAAAESVVRGATGASGQTASFNLIADNIVLDGFTIQDQVNPNSFSAAVHMGPGRSGIQVLNNIVQNNATGVNFTNASATNPAIIRRNLFQRNNLTGQHTGRALYTDGTISGGTLQNVIIDQNVFRHNRGVDPGFQVQPAIGIEAQTTTQTNIQITNNVFDNNGKHLLAFNASNLTITGNQFQEAWDTTSAGVRFEGGMSNVTIQSNNFYGSGARAIRIDKKVHQGPNTGFTITGNNFIRNGTDSGAANSAIFVGNTDNLPQVVLDGPLNAANNWWGASTGAGGDWGAPLGGGDDVWTNNAGNRAWVTGVGTFAVNPVVTQQAPWFGTPQVITSPIQFEDYDHGSRTVAYSDTSNSNETDAYHAYEGVDIAANTDGGIAGFHVGTTKAGEWIEYTVLVPASGTYTMTTRLANTVTGGSFHVEMNGTNISGTMTVANSAGAFVDLSKTGINLTAGTYVMRLQILTNTSGQSAGSFNWIRFTQTGVTLPAAPSNLLATPLSAQRHIQLNWTDNATGEANFILERSSNGTTAWTVVATPAANATSYLDNSPLPAGVRMYYRIRATGGPGLDSAHSNVANATIALPPLATPSAATATAASATLVNVKWIDTVPTELGFRIERSTDGTNYAQVGAAPANATTFADSTAAAATQYWYRVCAHNAQGNSYFSYAKPITTPAAQPSLPAPWAGADVGAVGAAGSASASNGTFTVQGSGADIWGAADEFRFVYQPWTGNGTIIARLATLQNTNAWAKGGVMFRESLDAGAKSVSVSMTPGSQAAPGNGSVQVARNATNGASTSAHSGGWVPAWFKLVRNGNTFTGFDSPDGVTWYASFPAQTIAMTANIYVGLCVTSKADGVLATATFDNVSVTGSTALRAAEPQASADATASSAEPAERPIEQVDLGTTATTGTVRALPRAFRHPGAWKALVQLARMGRLPQRDLLDVIAAWDPTVRAQLK